MIQGIGSNLVGSGLQGFHLSKDLQAYLFSLVSKYAFLNKLYANSVVFIQSVLLEMGRLEVFWDHNQQISGPSKYLGSIFDGSFKIVRILQTANQ